MSQRTAPNVSVEPRGFCIVGTGYVGMASAIGLAEFGHNVVGYDIIRERVRGLQNGITPYHEKGTAAALQRHLASGRLTFVQSLAEAAGSAEFIVIAIGFRDRRAPRYRPYRQDSRDSLDGVSRHDRFYRRSSSRNGERFTRAEIFTRRVGVSTLEDAGPFLSLFEHLGKPLIATSPREAELIKGFSNAYLALKISFANEGANLCDAVDADALVVLAKIGNDTRIGKLFLQPGIGSVFHNDVRSMHHIAGENDSSRELLAATLRVNEVQPRRIIDTLEEEVGRLGGLTIGVWGLTFKAGTDDVRDSLAIKIVADMEARSARDCAFDPAVEGPHTMISCELVGSPLDALNADALLVLTEWPMFREIPVTAIASALRLGVVIDGRNTLDRKALAIAGVTYRGVGRRAIPPKTPNVERSTESEVAVSNALECVRERRVRSDSKCRLKALAKRSCVWRLGGAVPSRIAIGDGP